MYRWRERAGGQLWVSVASFKREIFADEKLAKASQVCLCVWVCYSPCSCCLKHPPLWWKSMPQAKLPQKETNLSLTGNRICAAWDSRNASNTHVQITVLKSTFYFFPLTYREPWQCAPQCQSKEMVGELVVLVPYLTATAFAAVQTIIQMWTRNGWFKPSLKRHHVCTTSHVTISYESSPQTLMGRW